MESVVRRKKKKKKLCEITQGECMKRADASVPSVAPGLLVLAAFLYFTRCHKGRIVAKHQFSRKLTSVAFLFWLCLLSAAPSLNALCCYEYFIEIFLKFYPEGLSSV